MAVTARKDWDRLGNALAAGNVISGANTLSGPFGKDVPGVAPNKVTHIQFGANAPVAVPAGGIDVAGTHGTLHINPDGSYSYQRTLVWVGDVTPGSTDVFTYTLTDKNNASSTTSLTIEVLPETTATLDSKGVHKGTAFDDYINGDYYSVEQSDGRVAFDGGDGQDMIEAGEAGASRMFGGGGNDYLIGSSHDDILEGGAGVDEISGGVDGDDTASYASSKAGVTVDLTDNLNNAGGDAAGDKLYFIDDLIGSGFADTLTGSDKSNSLHGGLGNDIINGGDGQDGLHGEGGADKLFGDKAGDQLDGGAGADTLDGGDGDDTADYSSAAAKVTVNLSKTSLNTGDAKGDVYISIEQIEGSQFNDILIGSDGKDNLYGWNGNDIDRRRRRRRRAEWRLWRRHHPWRRRQGQHSRWARKRKAVRRCRR